MRILIADKLAPLVAGQLQDLGAEVRTDPALKGETLLATLRHFDPHILVVRSTKIEAAALGEARALSLIIRAGAGVNTIDLDAASRRGVYVATCPGKNAAAVAELTIGHLLNLDRLISENVRLLREGRWEKKRFSGARGLRGRTLALLGFGNTGREVAARAKALGMRVRVWSRSLTDAEAKQHGVERAETPEAAAEGADALSVHLALTPETRARVGESIFAQLPSGAYFINLARGEVVDEEALLRALDEKHLRAGLDVFVGEPKAGSDSFDHPLAKHPRVFGTHHIGASTAEASEAVGAEVVRIVQAFADGAEIPSCVNMAERSGATHRLIVRHADEVGVLAEVLNLLREAEINVQGMQNVLFSGGDAACARVDLEGEPSAELITALTSKNSIFDVQVGRV